MKVMNTKKQDVPIHNKYALSINEAAAYFNIGRHRLRSFINDHNDCNCFFTVGNRTMIIRELFEDMIRDMPSI